MNVVIVCDLLSTFHRFRRFLASEIRAKGHQLTVVASEDDMEDKSFFDESGICVEIVPMNRTGLNPFHDLDYYKRLLAFLKNHQPDAMMAYQAKAVVWSSIAARSLGSDVRTTVMFPGLGFLFAPNVDLKKRIVQSVSRLLYRFALKKVDNAIFQNPDDIKTVHEAGLLSASTKVVLVNGSGVNLDEFQYSEPPVDPIQFVMATRLLGDKGIREFADAAGRLKQIYGDRCEFLIAGRYDPNPAGVGESEVKEWEEKGWVRHVGFLDNMPEFLQSTSVFVLPSYYMEGTPRSILEALATGRPIVTTTNRGCRETVDDGVNGYLVEPRDVESLHDAMAKLIEKPDLIADFGKASRKMAETKYDVTLVNQTMVSTILGT